MASSTKWRLANITTVDGTTAAIGEIEMRATTGGADQCTGGTASASDYLLSSATYAPDKAFDNDAVGTFWHSHSIYPAYIQYDFGSSVVVTEVSIARRYASTGDVQAPSAFDVQYWNGSSWTTAWSVTGQGSWTGSIGETRVFTQPVTGYTLTAAVGSYAITGTAAAPLAGRSLAGAVGSYTIAGVAAALTVGRTLAAAPGSYAITGQATALYKGVGTLSGAVGAYSIAGTDIGFQVARGLVFDPGAYALVGGSATMTADTRPRLFFKDAAPLPVGDLFVIDEPPISIGVA